MRRAAIVVASVLFVFVSVLQAADDTPKAAAARKKLKQKVTVDYKDRMMRDIVDDLKEQVPGLGVRLDLKGGVSNNRKLTYKAKDKPLDEVLDEMFKKEMLGYVIISKAGDAYDGTVLIKVGDERGYPKGEQPKK